MRLLLGFGFVCAALIAVLAGLVFWPAAEQESPSGRETPLSKPLSPPSSLPPATEAAPATRPADASPTPSPTPKITLPDPPGEEPEAAADAPQRDVPIVTPVRWATHPDVRTAERRLRLAEATLADDPDHPLALRDAAEACRTLGRWREVAQHLHRLADLDPDDMDVQFDYAAALLTVGRTVEALEPLRGVTAVRPDDARAWHNLAAAHQSMGQLSAAERAWSRVLEIEATPAAQLQRGIVRLDLQDYTAAADDLRKYLEQAPDDAAGRLNLAVALEGAGQPAGAYVELLRVVDAQPRHLGALRRLAALSYRQWKAKPDNEHLAARLRMWCERCLEIAPDDERVRAWLDAL